MTKLLFIAVPCVAVLLYPGNAKPDPLCNPTHPDWTILPMEIDLNPNIVDLCASPGSTCNDFKDIRRTTQAALNEIWQNGTSHFSPRYVGTSGGNVHVYAGPCTSAEYDDDAILAQYTADPVGDVINWAEIRMCTNNRDFPDGLHWHSLLSKDAADNDPAAKSFQGVLLHELGHVIGMPHSNACPNNPASIMNRHFWPGTAHLYRADMGFLQEAYGYRTSDPHPMETADGLTYSVYADSPPGLVFASRKRYAATHNPFFAGLGGAMAATNHYWNGTTLNQSIYLAIFQEDLQSEDDWYHPTAWLVPGAQTTYHPAVAGSIWFGLKVAYHCNYDESYFGVGNICVNHTFDFGETWAGLETLDMIGVVDGNGVAASFDPNSDEFIYVWRGGIGQPNTIHYKVGNDSTGSYTLLDATAADTPSVACGDASVVGNYNCLLAWTDGTSWDRVVRWVQFQVAANGTFVTMPVMTHPYVSYGSADVAYLGDMPYPWLIAINQGGRATFTWRKGPSHFYTSFRDERSFLVPHGDRSMIPAIGVHTGGATIFVSDD